MRGCHAARRMPLTHTGGCLTALQLLAYIVAALLLQLVLRGDDPDASFPGDHLT